MIRLGCPFPLLWGLRLSRKSPARERDTMNTAVNFSLTIIGRVRSPFREATGTPIQSVYADGIEGQVILDASFGAALSDIDGFDRLWLIYWMDRTTACKLRVVPYRDTEERGLFATRSPCRPNPIGMSVVRLRRREENILYVADVDILDDTPLLDVKPYVPEFDAHPSSRAGWFEACGAHRTVADGRFHDVADPALRR